MTHQASCKDEARIGQKTKITRRWARRRTRPSAPKDQRTKSAYIFGAICPELGKGAGLFLPFCNTQTMSLHLAEISLAIEPGAHGVLLMDQAGWHMTGKLEVSGNISIIPLPPKCPELLVEEVSITSANINDSKAGPEALPDNPGEVFADSAYRGNHFCDAVRAKGGIARIVATGMWGRDEQERLRKLKEWNQPIHRVRGRIEKIFGTWKRCYGLRRMRWRGLAKAAVQVHLTAIAYNLKRTINILAAQA